MEAVQAILESWDRQAQCLHNLLTLAPPESLDWRSSQDGMTIAGHLAHTHETRGFWYSRCAGERMPGFQTLYVPLVENPEKEEDWGFTQDLALCEARLRISEKAIRQFIEDALAKGTQQCGHYDHPIYYLQHMVWHEGYHFGLVMLALRNGGIEPDDDQECALIWDLWRQPG